MTPRYTVNTGEPERIIRKRGPIRSERLARNTFVGNLGVCFLLPIIRGSGFGSVGLTLPFILGLKVTLPRGRRLAREFRLRVVCSSNALIVGFLFCPGSFAPFVADCHPIIGILEQRPVDFFVGHLPPTPRRCSVLDSEGISTKNLGVLFDLPRGAFFSHHRDLGILAPDAKEDFPNVLASERQTGRIERSE
jgi:hypothetical protein